MLGALSFCVAYGHTNDKSQKVNQATLSLSHSPVKAPVPVRTHEHLPDETDAKQILTASPAGNWTRPLGRPHITWMKTIQQDLKSSNLSMDDAVDLVQNRPLCRSMSMFGATHS